MARIEVRRLRLRCADGDGSREARRPPRRKGSRRGARRPPRPEEGTGRLGVGLPGGGGAREGRGGGKDTDE